MEMFAIIYNPTGVPVGLFVDSQNAIDRCKYLTESADFIVAKVKITEIEQVKFKRKGEHK